MFKQQMISTLPGGPLIVKRLNSGVDKSGRISFINKHVDKTDKMQALV